jgi:hypothetical protein
MLGCDVLSKAQRQFAVGRELTKEATKAAEGLLGKRHCVSIQYSSSASHGE